jgi:hypothetical protein
MIGAMRTLRATGVNVSRALRWAMVVACAVSAIACAQAHERTPDGGCADGCGATTAVDGRCTPGAWRACERFCTYEGCTASGTWNGACVEHGGPCDAGPRDDAASMDATVVFDADANAGFDGGIADAGRPCGVWMCTAAQLCVQTCVGHDVGPASDYQCVDVPPECVTTDCFCMAAHDSCVLCATPGLACDRCAATGP